MKSGLDQNSVEAWLKKFLSSTMPDCLSLERNKWNALEQHLNMVSPSVLDKITEGYINFKPEHGD